MDEAAAAPVSGILEDLAADDQVIVRIDPGKIVLAALLSLEFAIPLTMLVAYFVVAALTPLPMWSGLVAIVPMIMGMFGFISKRVITQFNYTLAQTRNGLRITRGLTNLVSQSVPAKRIQGISIHQPITWRPLGALPGAGRHPRQRRFGAGGGGSARTWACSCRPATPPTSAPPSTTSGRESSWRRSSCAAPLSGRAGCALIGWRYLRFGFDDQVAISESGWMSSSARSFRTPGRSRSPSSRARCSVGSPWPTWPSIDLAWARRTSRAHHLDEAVARDYAMSQLERARDARQHAHIDASPPAADGTPQTEPDRPWPLDDPFAPDSRDSGKT